MNQKADNRNLILGVTLGDPQSPRTYSGVPRFLFAEFDRMGVLAGTVNGYFWGPMDLINGAYVFRRSLESRRRCRNALWRYTNKGMDTLSKRMSEFCQKKKDFDTLFQFGVGPLPPENKKLAAHVEISLKTVLQSKEFSDSHGFHGHSNKMVKDAIAGEKRFLDRCSLVWTNSEWTAQGLLKQGVSADKLLIHPPAAHFDVPEKADRDWSDCRILFVGATWQRKGGHILENAFRILKKVVPNAQLDIVGCNPKIKIPGVKVHGYLRKNQPKENELLSNLFRNATIYCMPTLWDSTGIVFMEAALWELPVVMFAGQGREQIFPDSMAISIKEKNAETLARELINLANNPERMQEMGKAGRELVLREYQWPVLAEKLYQRICSI